MKLFIYTDSLNLNWANVQKKRFFMDKRKEYCGWKNHNTLSIALWLNSDKNDTLVQINRKDHSCQ